MKVKLGELVSIKTGKLDANAAVDGGRYPFFTCSKDNLFIDKYSYDCECVLVAGNGDLNVKYYNGKFDAYQRTYIIESKNNELYVPYLFWFMQRYVETLRKQSIGGVIKYIKLENLTDVKFNLFSCKEQKNLVEKLEKVQNIIYQYESQLKSFDMLIKSRFVEMFGDVEEQRFDVDIIGNLCDLKSGTTVDKKYELEKGEIIYCKVSDMNLAENSKYIVNSKQYLNREDCKKMIIKPNSVIFPKRGGAIGTNKKRITKTEICADLNIMAVTPRENINIEYLYQYFQNMDLLSISDGSTIPQLNNKNINPLKILVPPMKLQNDFASFVEQVDKSKFAVQKALEKTKMLMDSLMQEYFG